MKTIIIRLFEPAPGTGQVALHGVVEDVRTGSTAAFDSVDELLRTVAALAGRAADDERKAEQNCWS